MSQHGVLDDGSHEDKTRQALVELLIDGGALVDRQTADGTSPLIIAARQGHAEMVRLLLRRGATPSLADANGDDAEAAAGKQRMVAAAALLRDVRLAGTWARCVRRADVRGRGRGEAAAAARIFRGGGRGRGDAAAAARIFRGDGSRRRRGCRADIPWGRGRGEAAAAARIFRGGGVAATPRLPRGYSVGTGSRRRRGCRADIPWGHARASGT